MTRMDNMKRCSFIPICFGFDINDLDRSFTVPSSNVLFFVHVSRTSVINSISHTLKSDNDIYDKKSVALSRLCTICMMLGLMETINRYNVIWLN